MVRAVRHTPTGVSVWEVQQVRPVSANVPKDKREKEKPIFQHRCLCDKFDN